MEITPQPSQTTPQVSEEEFSYFIGENSDRYQKKFRTEV